MPKKKPINKNYTKEIVKGAIKARFGTIKKYAEKKDITEDAMYERLQYLSDNFLSELKQDGILVDKAITQITGDIAANGEMILSNINAGKGLHAEEHHYHNSDGFKEAYSLAMDKVKQLAAEVERLKKENVVLKRQVIKK